MNELIYKQGFQIFGLEISFYSVFVLIGILAGGITAVLLCKKRGFTVDTVLDLLIIVIPSAIVGARAYYVVFDWSSGNYKSFLDVISFWNGGIAIYGAAIGGGIGILIYALVKKYSVLKILDFVVPAFIIGQAFGRIGCTFAGCCYGKETGITTFPIAIIVDGEYHLATNLYESLMCFIGYPLLFALCYKISKPSGIVFSAYLIYYGIVRCVIEGFRGDSLYFFGTGLRSSQLLSIILIVCGVALAVYIILKNNKLGENNGQQ